MLIFFLFFLFLSVKIICYNLRTEEKIPFIPEFGEQENISTTKTYILFGKKNPEMTQNIA